jgi:hypothetical protein
MENERQPLVTSCRTTVIAAFQDVREPGGSTASVRLSECDALAGSKEPQAVCQPSVAEGGVDLGRAFAEVSIPLAFEALKGASRGVLDARGVPGRPA